MKPTLVVLRSLAALTGCSTTAKRTTHTRQGTHDYLSWTEGRAHAEGTRLGGQTEFVRLL